MPFGGTQPAIILIAKTELRRSSYHKFGDREEIQMKIQ